MQPNWYRSTERDTSLLYPSNRAEPPSLFLIPPSFPACAVIFSWHLCAQGDQEESWPHLGPTDWFPPSMCTLAQKNPEHLLYLTALYTKLIRILQSLWTMGLVGAIGFSLVLVSLTQVNIYFSWNILFLCANCFVCRNNFILYCFVKWMLEYNSLILAVFQISYTKAQGKSPAISLVDGLWIKGRCGCQAVNNVYLFIIFFYRILCSNVQYTEKV